MRLRNISRLFVIVLVVLVGAVALIHQRLTSDAAPSSPALVGGTALNDPVPPMSLRDQNGALVTTQSLSGRPTVLTFMDMTCTSECPIQAQLLNQTAQFLGAQKARQVNWIIVSVNPTNTPADADAFLKNQKVTLPVKVLLGTQAQLEPVWHAYHIYVKATPTDVNHTVALFLIDKSGRQRMVFIDGFDPKALSQDLSTLLG
jgi:protein SCO1/2